MLKRLLQKCQTIPKNADRSFLVPASQRWQLFVLAWIMPLGGWTHPEEWPFHFPKEITHNKTSLTHRRKAEIFGRLNHNFYAICKVFQRNLLEKIPHKIEREWPISARKHSKINRTWTRLFNMILKYVIASIVTKLSNDVHFSGLTHYNMAAKLKSVSFLFMILFLFMI